MYTRNNIQVRPAIPPSSGAGNFSVEVRLGRNAVRALYTSDCYQLCEMLAKRLAETPRLPVPPN